MPLREDFSQLTTLIGQHYPFTPDNEKGGALNDLSAIIHPRPEYSTIPNFTFADDVDQLNCTPVKLNNLQLTITPCKAQPQEKGI
jgi:hypothetical protein